MKCTFRHILYFLADILFIVIGNTAYTLTNQYVHYTFKGSYWLLAIYAVTVIAVTLLVLLRTVDCMLNPAKASARWSILLFFLSIALLFIGYLKFVASVPFLPLLLIVASSDLFYSILLPILLRKSQRES